MVTFYQLEESCKEELPEIKATQFCLNGNCVIVYRYNHIFVVFLTKMKELLGHILQPILHLQLQDSVIS